jgi:CheY-like chemotaxis protein
MRLRILVADDEVQKGNTAPDKLISQLEKLGYEVKPAATSQEAISLARQNKWDVAIVDLRWQNEKNDGDHLGWAIVEALRGSEQNKDAKIIMYSGYLDPDILVEASSNKVIAVPKMRPSGPPPGEKEHLTSLVTMIRTLQWLIAESNSQREQIQSLETERDDMQKELNQTSILDRKLRGVLILLAVCASLAVTAVAAVQLLVPGLASMIAVMLLVLFLALVALAATGLLPERMVVFFANKFGDLFVGGMRG